MSFSIIEGDVVLRDQSGNPIAVVLDGVTYRLAVEAKVVSSVLPSGAATESTLLSLLTQSSFESRVNTLGQKASSASTPVVIASDQTTIPVNDNGSSLTVDNVYIDASISTLATEATTQTLLRESEFESRVGEVQPVPTANTILGRLKDIDDVANTLATENTVSGLLTELDFDSRIGEVQPVPSQNTVLGRLKDIDDGIVSLVTHPGNLGQATMTGSAPVVIASDQTDVPVSQGLPSSLSGYWPIGITDGTDLVDVDSFGRLSIQNPPNLDVASSTLATESTLSTILTEANFDSRVGEVQPTPTANTILGRLKDIDDVANTLATEATAATLLTEADFDARLGEVQPTPTANTILGRLKDIDDVANTLATEATASTLLTEADFDSRVGEVQSTPTANTVLGRLKDVDDGIRSLVTYPTNLGQTTMTGSAPVVIASNQTDVPVSQGLPSSLSGYWPIGITDGADLADVDSFGRLAIQNPPNLDVAASTLATESTALTLLTELEFETRIGEVQASPTVNTVLGRLKSIEDINSTLLTEADFDSRMGEVQAEPTAYTNLGRLKAIEDQVVARLGTLGQKEMVESTPVVIASDQSRVLVEATIANEDGLVTDIVQQGTRVAQSIEYPQLLDVASKIFQKLLTIEKHLASITDEEWGEHDDD